MTLTDDNFASIVAAVEEGRIVFGNIRKFLLYLLSANIGEIGLMAGTVLLGLPLPLTAVQILYINLATDGLPALALAVDPPLPELMRQAPRPRGEGVFAGLLWRGRPLPQAMTLVFVSLALIEFLKTYLLRTLTAPAWPRPFANRWLNRAVLWELTLLLGVVYLPPLQRVFGTYALTGRDWLLCLGTAAALIPWLEGVKALLRR
jgi:Ca2+-transporting ATPase